MYHNNLNMGMYLDALMLYWAEADKVLKQHRSTATTQKARYFKLRLIPVGKMLTVLRMRLQDRRSLSRRHLVAR